MIVDLFAGPGGWDLAASWLGLPVVGLERDASACATRAAAGHLTVRADVTTYPTAPFRGRITGNIGSPVCTPYSRAGLGLGVADLPLVHQAVADLAAGRDTRAELTAACADPNSLLAAEPMRWLADLRPEWAALEQVPDVLPLWRQYAAVLRAWGYSVWCGVLNAADYGVPQTRRRAILIASRLRDVTAPPATHDKDPQHDLFGECLKPWVSMADALGWGATERSAPTSAGGGKTRGAKPFPSQARQALIKEQERGAWALRNGTQKNACTRDLDEPAGTLFFGQRCNDVLWVLRNGNQPNAAIRSVEEPAPTMAFGHNAARIEWVQDRPATTVCGTPRISPPGHRDRRAGGESQYASPDTVRITIAEAARLQSFPATYPWQGSKTQQFQQIGNAVPPLLAAHVLAVASGARLPEGVTA